MLFKPVDGDLSARTVEEVALKAGPAVRMHVIAKAPKSRRRDPTVVLDTIQYWVPVPRRDEMIVLVGTTPSLGPREDLAATIEALVASLRFTYFS